MDGHIADTRRQLGELGAMAQQTQDMERRIQSIATQRLEAMRGEMESARADALTGDDAAKARYADLVRERGRLEQVIAAARLELGTD